MKLRNIILSIGCLIGTWASYAVEPVSDLFVQMPDSLLPTIEVNRRKDMIDLMRAGQSSEATTRLGSQAAITLMQDSLLAVKLSELSSLQIQLYQQGDETIIALVNTVCAPACDSRIRFYSHDWKELPTSKYIRRIDTHTFLNVPDTLPATMREDIERLTDISLIEYTFEANGILRAQNSWETYWDEESFKLIQPYLIGSILLHWNGKRLE